jgi:hypothetical protein
VEEGGLAAAGTSGVGSVESKGWWEKNGGPGPWLGPPVRGPHMKRPELQSLCLSYQL